MPGSGKIVRRNKNGQFYQKDAAGKFTVKEDKRGPRGSFDDPGTPTAAILRRNRGEGDRETLPGSPPVYKVLGP